MELTNKIGRILKTCQQAYLRNRIGRGPQQIAGSFKPGLQNPGVGGHPHRFNKQPAQGRAVFRACITQLLNGMNSKVFKFFCLTV